MNDDSNIDEKLDEVLEEGLEETRDTEEKDLSISIENVVASASLDQKIDLLAIMKVFRNVEYRPKQFPGLVFRLKRPKTATLIFGSGKMVCTGAKSMKLARSAVRKVVRELKNNGIIILGKPTIVIQNIVASANLHGKIDLETAADIMENVMYEPEQFPGLIYRMGVPKVVLLLFASGKLVCTGAKTEDMVKEAVEKVHVILQDFDLIYYE
ncbi:MAG: TATA-box-binding protein [Candidatus Bathyarchaeota archaeon]|nr:TATA-box-binding protein [Candidatus Bathyarchaeota archaeon]